MTHLPLRFGALFSVLACGACLAPLLLQEPDAGFLSSAAAQEVGASPSAAPATPATQQTQNAPAADASSSATSQALAAGMAHTDAQGRHLAPRGTFYLLSYVSARTPNGVEGFDPGQEVHLVEVHRQTHTLVVSDGRAQVEVPPSKLTNDIDIAALVRQKDKAKQARITAYIQSEEAAYSRAEARAAAFTARDLARRQQAEEAQAAASDQAPVQPTPEPADDSVDNGYYNEGGYGYGSPYGYFVDVPESAGDRQEDRHDKAPQTAVPAPAPKDGVLVGPAGSQPGEGGRPK
jgi:hypothetical protein